ncbi:MAG: hypothetical protein GF346_00195 [Candidatus Eisenbacteria bacterium]|nr:hypothetical protein [Candidatus Latescibacterota bacterium]MBD3300852.1 hypothetical protein [Candidatus Eisenbacteria bacterium]
MKKTGPVILGFLVGTLMLIQFFTPNEWIEARYNNVLDWKQVVFGITLILGVISLFVYHWKKIEKRSEGWGYSVVTVAGLLFMIVVALIFSPERGPYPWMFDHVQAPMQATMFALLAFYVASASYRAFRARSFHAALLLIAGVVVMLGRVPLGELIGLQHVSSWILDYPNLAAKRGILIGVGLGMVSTAIKIIVGIERTYLGKGA